MNVRQQCNSVWASADEQNLCYRSLMAAQSLGNLLATMGHGELPSLETPDQSMVTMTEPGHPRAQCRLDTYSAGALCQASFRSELIPGRRQAEGQNGVLAELEATSSSCTRQGAYGRDASFLYAWARATVINTGSIALLAFVFGDYVSTVIPLGRASGAVWAAIIVVVLTALNIVGVRASLRRSAM